MGGGPQTREMLPMLVLETEDGRSEFAMRLLARDAGRGVRKKVAVDEQGRVCRRALMTHDGVLLPPGAVAESYEDGDGNTVKAGDVIPVDIDGCILRHLPVTRDRPQRPVGPVPIEEVLEHVASRVYALSALTLARDLGDALAGGAVYRVAWRPRASVEDKPAFLLGNARGFFLLQCEAHMAEFICLDQPVVVDEDFEEDEWDEWDMNAQVRSTGDSV